MDIKKYVLSKCAKAKEASYSLSQMGTHQKDDLLMRMADSLLKNKDSILSANEKDLAASKLPPALRDRLMLDERRLKAISDDVRKVAALPDPVGEVLEQRTLQNGLHISRIRVPLGVIGIIYESRPNVTVDAATLCLKSGNAVILRGGSEALNSNKALAQALQVDGLPDGAIGFIDVTDRKAAQVLMEAREYVDVLIPRGGAGLIKAVVENSTVPVIETGIGNCHVYVDESADLEMAKNIAINAKCQRPGVCNAIEKLIVSEKISGKFVPLIGSELSKRGVELKGDKESVALLKKSGIKAALATDADWSEEYLSLKIAIKIVKNVDEAIEHINKYGSKHSESIITQSDSNAKKFLSQVDAAAVYHNASTRFTDGGQFGLGAEIGISTQKLHARGPMALRELTSYKYVIEGNGQIRA